MNKSGSRHRGPHVDDDVCIDLILDVLPKSEAEVALRHMACCTDCEKRFKKMAGDWERAAAHTAINSRPTLVEPADLAGWERTRSVLRHRRVQLGFAAVAVVLLLALLIPGRLADPVPLHNLPEVTTELRTRTGVIVVPNAALLDALEAYNENDYARAADGLRAIEVSGAADAFRNVYLASSLAWMGRHDEAVAVLEVVPFDLVPEPWSGEARWTMYASLVAGGQHRRAETLLDELAEEAGDVGERARRRIAKDN